jgi:hypothetical protein
MEPIHVPRPPAEAFNKNRPVSGLIRAQVNHFKHVERKLSAEQRRTIPQQGVTTEAGAAKYIAAMTAALRGQPAAVPSTGATAVPGIRLVAPATSTRPEPAEGLAIAASADPAEVSLPPAAAPSRAAAKKKASPPKGSSKAAEKLGNSGSGNSGQKETK